MEVVEHVPCAGTNDAEDVTGTVNLGSTLVAATGVVNLRMLTGSLAQTTYILKILRSVEPHQRQAAADSILVEVTARRNDPVRGCLAHHFSLTSQIDSNLTELPAVNQLLAFCRNQNTHPANSNSSSIPPPHTDQSIVSYGEDVKPFDIKEPSSHEKGESSTNASRANEKEKLIVEEEDATEAYDKGKQIACEEDTEEEEEED